MAGWVDAPDTKQVRLQHRRFPAWTGCDHPAAGKPREHACLLHHADLVASRVTFDDDVAELQRPVEESSDTQVILLGHFTGSSRSRCCRTVSPCSPAGAAASGTQHDAAAVLPALADADLVDVDAARPESCAVDDVPVIDLVPGTDNVWFGTGWSGHGFAIAPAAPLAGRRGGVVRISKGADAATPRGGSWWCGVASWYLGLLDCSSGTRVSACLW